MHKVVVERPRWNPGPTKSNRQANLDPDLLPACEGMRRPYRSRKAFTDLLGPLRRWLRAQLGRPWDDVYSEACAVIKPDSIVRAHIKTHLLEFVQRHTFLRDGRVWCYGRSWFFTPGIEKPVEEAASRWVPFYVHPANGRLYEVPLAARARRNVWKDLRQSFAPEQRWLSDTRALLRLNGLWFDCVMEAFPPYFNRGDEPVRRDVALKRALNRSQAYDRYGRYVFCVAKRQLSSKELRRRGLTNHAANIAPTSPPESRPDGFPRRSHRAGTSAAPAPFEFNRVNHNHTTEVPMQNHDQPLSDQPSFEITSKRRRGFPSETQVGRGHRVVHGDKDLIEKLGRNDLCPCGSGRKFPHLLPALRPLRRLAPEPLFSASDHRSRFGSLPDRVEQAASLLRCASNRGLAARAT